MLWTVSVILMIMWLIGMVSQLPLGGFIHLLLISALITLSISMLQERRPGYVLKPIKQHSKNKR